MIDYGPCFDAIKYTRLAPWLKELPALIQTAITPEKNSNLQSWKEALAALPDLFPQKIDVLNEVRIDAESEISELERAQLTNTLKMLHPWRKGPYSLFGIHIDTEWHSDWKWDRLKDNITSLENRLVLDVGCGNGYHCWRMAGAGARLVIGIDPYLLSVCQYHALRAFLPDVPAWVLPLKSHQLPENLPVFDTVFSMGVLYHHRSPFEHIAELRACLRPGGELILETLVIDGGKGQVLVPEKRYAKMRNVWFIPTVPELESWLKKCGFSAVRTTDVTTTTPQEQRRTDWMTFESLADFLDPDDPTRTIEGHPAPKRALMICQHGAG